MNRRLAWGRIAFILAGVGLFVVLLRLGPPPAGQNSDFALRILANALSILAGFLIAVIVMLGDPRSLYRGSWRIASAHRREIRRALNRTAYLFCAYLAVIALVFVASLLDAYALAAIDPRLAIIDPRWMKHIALSSGVMVLFWSFALPLVILKAQLDRLDEEVEDRKQQSSLSSAEGTDTARADD